jgi:hypothetical protein
MLFVKDYARALESMKEAEMWMKYSTLSETKTVSFKKDISKQIEFLAEKVSWTLEIFFNQKLKSEKTKKLNIH